MQQSRALRFALLTASIVVALLFLEGAVRVRQWMRFGTTTPDAVPLVRDPESELRFAKPRLSTARIHTDSHGFRNPELQMPKPPGRVRLAFLGGSTTFCSEVSGDAAAWPSLVAQEIQARYPDVSFDFVNAGEPGYDVEASLKNLRLRVAPLQPDLILYYEASNDLSKDTRLLARRAGLYAGEAEQPSALARVSSAWGLIEKNLVYRRRASATGTGPRLAYDADSLAGGFQARLAELLRASRQVAPVVAVATFSHKVRRDQSPDAQVKASGTSLYYAPYMSVAGLLDGWDAYNRAIRSAAAETNAILIEGEETIPGDDVHFADSVHFLDPGSRRMAERVATALLASPEFQRLVESKRSARAARS
jgi:lysophospholipase L1-like esterase